LAGLGYSGDNVVVYDTSGVAHVTVGNDGTGFPMVDSSNTMSIRLENFVLDNYIGADWCFPQSLGQAAMWVRRAGPTTAD
jgi:hypothetical protein